jgi:ATP-dependent RNA helicase RhlE
VKIHPQITALRSGIDILVATPGRLLALWQQGEVDFSGLEVLVLDEADRMLDMGFIDDIRRILKLLPVQRQNLLFSATFAPPIRALAKTILQNPQQVSVTQPNATPQRVEQWLYPVDKKRKAELLLELVEQHDWQQVLVFCRTRQGANQLARYLQASGINVTAIHSDKSQDARTRALEGFKRGKIRVLVATDVAARGLDIAQLPQVVNFDLPSVPEDYIHRIGRTGRAGLSGRAYSLVSADEIKQLNGIEQLIQRHITREYIGGFEPGHEVPASAPLRKARPSGQAPVVKSPGARRKSGARPKSPTPRRSRRGRGRSGQ